MSDSSKDEFEKKYNGPQLKLYRSLGKFTDYNIDQSYLKDSWPTLSESMDDIEYMNIDFLSLTFVYMYLNPSLQGVFTADNSIDQLNQYTSHVLSTPVNINLLDQIIKKSYGKLDKNPEKDTTGIKNDFRLWTIDDKIKRKMALFVAIYASKIIATTSKYSS